MKARNYRWNSGDDGGPRAWCIDVTEGEDEVEIAFLREAVFGPDWNPRPRLITAYDRFSDRC
ncbi:MAG: hypothetical protein ABSA13_18345 [Beijerinckiaceae bacterium]|jgi:hypothetical protein